MTDAPPQSSIILYQTEDGRTRIECRFENETIWLTQAQIAELFQTSVPNIHLHLKAIYAERELTEEATLKSHLIVRTEGSRQISREVLHYNLSAILAVGYRVRSHRGTQFRQWATARLSEYLVKGFTMDDERLKNPPGKGRRDYFDELLERIRDIHRMGSALHVRRWAGAALLIAASASVEACTFLCNCPPGEPSVRVLAPAQGATDVPLNALLWVGVGISDELIAQSSDRTVTLELMGPDGPVSGTMSAVAVDLPARPGLNVFRPDAALAPLTTYVASVNGVMAVSFTTGTTTAGPPPGVVTAKVNVPLDDGAPFSCAPDMVTYELSAPGALTGIFMVLQLEGQPNPFDPETLTGMASFITTAPEAHGVPVEFEFTGDPCGNWTGAGSHVRFGVVDVAGQFSGWSGWYVTG